MENQTNASETLDPQMMMRETLHEAVDGMDTQTVAAMLAMYGRFQTMQPPVKLHHLDKLDMVTLTAGLLTVIERNTDNALQALATGEATSAEAITECLGAIIDRSASALLVAAKIMHLGEFRAVDLDNLPEGAKKIIQAEFNQTALNDLVEELQPTVDALIASQQKSEA